MFDAMLKGLVLNFQSYWIVPCKILSLTFNHLGCYAVRSCPQPSDMLDDTLQVLVLAGHWLRWIFFL